MPSSSASALSQPLLPAIADTHICGTCKKHFTDINHFISHKHNCHTSPGTQNVAESLTDESPPISKPRSHVGVPINSTTPVFRVFVERGQINQLGTNQENHLTLQHLRAQGNPESVILRSRLVGVSRNEVLQDQRQTLPEGTSIQCQSVQQQNDGRRDFEMDDEDVASILANQLAKEVIASNNCAPPKPSNDPKHSFSSSTIFSLAVDSVTQNKVLTSPDHDTHANIVVASHSEAESLQYNVDKSSSSEKTVGISIPLPRSRVAKHYKCDTEGCNFTSVYQKDLTRHGRTHTGEKPFHCTLCQRAFSRRDKLKAHRRIHDGIKPHHCQVCSYATADTAALRKHMRVHNDERPFKCQICAYRSRDSSQLTVHLRTHTGDHPFVCPYEQCTSKFKTSSDLKRHIRMHTGEKPYGCEICEYRCTIKSNLRVHMNLNHTKPKPVPCPACDHVATSKRAAKEHSKIHAAEVLQCGLCSFSCVSQTSMANHMRIHTQPKPINCKHCFYSCRQLTNLRRHMKTKHSDLRPKSDVDKDGSHIRGNSANSKQFGYKEHHCTYCSASFVREDSWRVHVRQHKNRGSVPMTPDKLSNSVCPPEVQDSELITPQIASYSKQSPGVYSKDIREPVLETLQLMRVERDETPPQEHILSSNALQAQPMYVYLHNDGSGEMAPIMFSRSIDQYVTLPTDQGTIVQQLAVSLQGGIQYVLSGPIDRVESGDNTFVQSPHSSIVNQIDITASGNEATSNMAKNHLKIDTPGMKKFGNQTL